jgi:nitronate monooxygenase
VTSQSPSNFLKRLGIALPILPAPMAAVSEAGEFGYGADWTGQGAPLVRKMSAGALVRALAAEPGQQVAR